MLTTLGTIHPDPLDIDIERDVVDMDDGRIGDLEMLSTAIGGEDGEPLSDSDGHNGSPAPAYNTLDHDYRDRRFPPQAFDDSMNRGLRINIEQVSTTRL